MRQLDHLDVSITGLVDLGDDALQSNHVHRAVGNDQHVRGCVGGQMAPLRYQRAQDRYQLRGRYVLDLQYAGNHFFLRQPTGADQQGAAFLAHRGFGNDLDRLACGHRGEAVNLQHGQEGFVDAVRAHRRGRDHGDLALHALVDDEVATGDLADRGDQRVDVRVLDIERRLIGACVIAERQGRAQQRDTCHGNQVANMH